MKTKFNKWQNCLRPETAEKLYTDFVEREKPLPWDHRGFGRFVHDLTDTEYGQAVKDDITSDIHSPFYEDQHYAETCTEWIQCFVPGAVLPLHREYVKSVGTVYLNKTLWQETQSGFMEWYEAASIGELFDEPIHQSLPKFNTGNYYKNPDIDSDDKIFNPWHRVHRNNATYKRYSLQIFEPAMQGPEAVVSNSTKMIEQGFLQVVGWDKATEHYPDGHSIYDYSCWHPEIMSTWQKENKEMIESMTL